MTNSRDRRSFEAILREPLTRQRLLLNAKIRAAQKGGEQAVAFTLDDFKNFVNGVQATSRTRAGDPALAAEIANAVAAVETGVPLQAPKFETPETQLVWGAALAYLLLNQQQMQSWQTPAAEGELRSSDLWKQIVNTRRAHNELLSHAHHVREALRDKDTKYGWSDPGTGFTFQRQKNIINIDLMQSLIVGFEHARADVYREIGHSLLSVAYPKRMREVYAEMQPLMRKMQQAQGKGGKKGQKGKGGPKLNDEEYKKLRLLSAEWQLRHMMYSAAEENVTSRFVANMGAQMLQDYSVSMNNTAVTFRGIGLTRLPADGQMSQDLRRYMNLCNTVQISFYQNNGMFADTDAGWRGVGIDPSLVRKLSTLAGRPADAQADTDGIGHADFVYLRELCRGPNGLENQQPKQHERLYGWGNLKNRIGRAAGERAAIVEQIWALYAEDLIRNILEHTKDQIEEDLEQAKQNQQDQQDGQDGDDGQDGQDQDGQDQDGQDQDGQGQGQGQGQGKGKPQKGQKPQKNKNKDRNKPQGDQKDPDDLDDADGDEQDGQKGDTSKKKDKSDKGDKKDKGDKGDKSGQDGDEQDDDGNGADGDEQDGQDGDGQGKNGKDGELGADKDDTVPVEGAGDMPAPEAPFEDPSDELDPDADGQDADGEGQDGEGNDADGSDADGDDGDAMTQEELEQALQEMDEAEEGDDADGQDADGDGQDAEGQSGAAKKSKRGKGGKKAGHAEGKKLGDLAAQDWTQYQQRINELAPTIARVRKLFKEVQERQLQRKSVMSSKLEMLPENGEVKNRFNAEAHRNLTLKKLTGQVTADDFKRFHPDEIKMTPTQIDIVLMIDGSGSMNTNRVGSAGVSVLDCALQASAIMYEAAAGKDMNIKVYVGLWGDSNPPIIIHPGADRVKVGQAMQAARKGLHSGTDFAPAVKKVAQVIAEDRGTSGVLSGFTHVLILSDGDIFDQQKSVEMVNTMFAYSDKVTFDVAVMGRVNSAMEQMARTIKGHKPFQQVGVALGNDPNTIPLNIVGLLLDKVRKCGSFIAVPSSEKRRAMQKAHNKMEPKR